VTFTENEIAIFNKDAKTTSIRENMMDSNEIGFASHSSSGTLMKTNLLLSNELAGVTLVNSQGNEISNNIIKGSVNGIL
jgi:parallel beta-helix repeat protein